MNSKRTFRGSYLCYAITFFFFCFSTGVFSQVLSIYLTGIGKTTTEMTFIISSSNLFGIALIPIFGFIVDRVKKPYMIMGTMFAAGVLSLIFAVSRNTWVLYMLNGLIMGIMSALNPIFENMAGNGKYRYGMVRCWGTIGYAVSASVAAVLLDVADPRLIFVVFALSVTTSALCFFGTGVISYREKPEAQQPKKLTVGQQIFFLKSPLFLLFVVIALLFAAVTNVNNTFAPMLLKELGVSTSFVGTALLLSTLMEVPIVFFSNKFMGRFSGKILAAASFLMMFLQFAVYGVTDHVLTAFIAMLLLKAVSSQLFVMTMLKVVRGIVHENAVATALGVINSVNAVSTIVMHNVGGKIADAAGIQALYLTLAVMSAAAFLLCMFLKVKNTESRFF